jgi:hypothetical protein
MKVRVRKKRGFWDGVIEGELVERNEKHVVIRNYVRLPKVIISPWMQVYPEQQRGTIEIPIEEIEEIEMLDE